METVAFIENILLQSIKLNVRIRYESPKANLPTAIA